MTEEIGKFVRDEIESMVNMKDIEVYAKSTKNKELFAMYKEMFRKLDFRWRLSSMADFRNGYMMGNTYYDYVTFDISKTTKEHGMSFESTYAIVYMRDGEYEYVCTSPSLKSSDGEYRDCIIPFYQCVAWLEKYGNTEEYKGLMDMINKEIEDDVFELNTYGAPDIVADMMEKKYDVLLYAVAWVKEYFKVYEKTYDNHVNSNYYICMFSPTDEVFFKKNIREKNIFYEWLTMLKYLYIDPVSEDKVGQCGQKLIPMTLYTIENENDITVPLWREIYITNILGNLVTNAICIGLPFFIDWYLLDTAPELFDNVTTLDKLYHSEITKKAVKEIEEVRKETYLWDNEIKKEIYLSEPLGVFNEKLEVPLDLAEAEIILSDYTACIITDYMGRTFFDHPRMCLHSDKFDAATGNMFNNYNAIESYLFGYLYTLWTMNKYYGIIHADLHLNNITTFTTMQYEPGSMEIYNVGGDMYAFPGYIRKAAIIDFSRSFTWGNHLRESFSEKKVNRIRERHIQRLLRYIPMVIPEFATDHMMDILLLVDKNFEAFYTVCEALDPIKLLGSLRDFIENDVIPRNEYSPIMDIQMLSTKFIPLVDKLLDEANEYLIYSLQKLFDDPKAKIERINLSLIRSFEHRLLENTAMDDFKYIRAYYKDSHEIKYNMFEYDKYPPLCKREVVIEHGGKPWGKEKIPDNTDLFLRNAKQEKIMMQISEESKKNKSKRRGIHEYDTRVFSREEIEEVKKSSSELVLIS